MSKDKIESAVKIKEKKVKRKSKFVRFRHIVVFAILRPFFLIYFRIKYHYTFEKYKGKSEGMLILSNHAVTLDPFFLAMSFNFPVYFVASDQLFNLGFASRAIEYLVAPIPKSKGISDIKCVRDIMTYTKEGGAVSIFVEGNRTFTGLTCTIPDQIGKLIKLIKKPVVIYNIKGGYFSKPRWALKARTGKMRGEIREIWQVKDYENLSYEEIYQKVKDSLFVDAYAEQEKNPVKYKCARRAENLENVLYFCPNCKRFHTLVSSGKLLTCVTCGAKVEYTEYGELKPLDDKTDFTRIVDWFNWQNQYIIDNKLYLGYKEKPIFSMDNCKLYLDERAKKRNLIGKGKFGIFDGFMEFIGENGEGVYFDFKDVYGVTPQVMGKMQIYTNDNKSYVITCDKKESVLSYVVLFYIMKNIMEGNGNEFLGF